MEMSCLTKVEHSDGAQQNRNKPLIFIKIIAEHERLTI